MEDLDIPKLDAIEIPDKTHFKIGEVAKLLELEPYVLRYWEKEFEVLEPGKTESGQRSYQRDDIELLATIRELLYTEMFTIDGACRQLERAREGKPSYLTARAGEGEGGTDPETLVEIRDENEKLRGELERLSEARAEWEARIEQLEGKLKRARRAAEESDSDERVDRWRERARKYRSENETLRSQLAEAKARIEELEQEAAELEERASRREPEPEVVEALHGEVTELARLAESSSTAQSS